MSFFINRLVRCISVPTNIHMPNPFVRYIIFAFSTITYDSPLVLTLAPSRNRDGWSHEPLICKGFMTRFYVRGVLCALVAISITTLLALIHPHDDYELRWMLPNSCLASCFMGIRPGVTTVEEATKLLKAHPWVNQVIMIKNSAPYQMAWTWSDKAPDFLKNAPTNPELPISGEILFDKGVASNIGFSTHLTFGDIALAWRYPDDAQLIFPALIIAPDSSVLAVISIEYQDFRVSGTLNCPYSTHIWQTPIYISVMDKSSLAVFSNAIPINGRNFLGRIRHTSHLMCSRQY
jgi:hypothetical protein